MKKKWIIIGSCGIAFIALVTILLIILLGGASFSDMSQQVFNSMNKVQTVDSVTTVKDGEIIVYQYGKKVEIKDSNKAVVTTSESEYNSNFEFETKSSSEEVAVSKEELLMISLGESLFKDIEISKDKMTMVTTSENIKEVFNNDSLVISGDAKFEFIFDGELISKIICSYKLLSGKDVVIDITYTY